MGIKTLQQTTLFAVFLCTTFTGLALAQTQRRSSFDADWRFNLGDAADASKADYSDSAWRKLDLPHDWMIEGPPGKDPSKMEGPFDNTSPGGDGNGYLNGGVGWYRKTFSIPAEAKGRHIAIDFDGIYMNSEVWINGTSLGKHPYGYTSFEYDLTPYLKYGEEKNVIAVRAEVMQPCSRFYSGAGIYRHVWLINTSPVHVDHWGTYVTTEVKGDTAMATVHTTVVNDGAQPATVSVSNVCGRPDGKEGFGSKTPQTITLNPAESKVVTEHFEISRPELWSPESPQRYELVTKLLVDQKPVDSCQTWFGIRTIDFTVDKGFFLNGKHFQIQGVCEHHDLGCLGAAVNRRAIQRQFEILKSFGVNAIRTSHYPPTPELLDLADEMGFVVMDEAFDEWKNSKTKFGYGQFFDEWSERDIVSMVHRDRNHPSIVLWSIGNEINEQGDKDGEAMAKRLSDIVHREDPTRPTTSAMSNPNGAEKSGFAKALGVFGVNYNAGFYNDPRAHGEVPMIGSETSSTVSSRGEYGLKPDRSGKLAAEKKFNNQVNSYGGMVPGWATPVETALQMMSNDDWMAGEFVWTGFDYIGEPTPFNWPSRSSYFGVVDLAGFPKDRYYLYKAQWTREPVVHLLPHWNWEQFAGKEIPVWCFTNADSVELFLNDKSLGVKTWRDRKPLHMEWSVPFAPGVLKAVGTTNGRVVATDEVRTTGKPAKLVLKADRSQISTDHRDLSFITVSVVDADGNVCPNADNEIEFKLEGPGKIAGLDNGDPTNHESFQGHQHKVFDGLGLVVLEAGTDAGNLTLTATTDGMPATATTVSIK